MVQQYFTEYFRRHQLGAGRYRHLTEQADRQALHALVSGAIEYFEEQRNEVIALPATSPEKAIIEGSLGLLRQAFADDGDVHSIISTLSDSMKQLVEGMDNENGLRRFVIDLTGQLNNLAIQITDVDDEPAADAVEPSPKDEPAPSPDIDEPPPDDKEDEEEEENPDSQDSLAKALGVI